MNAPTTPKAHGKTPATGKAGTKAAARTKATRTEAARTEAAGSATAAKAMAHPPVTAETAGQPAALAHPTVVELFHTRVAERGDRPALRRHGASGWEHVTWTEYGASVDRIAAALIDAGVAPGDRIGLFSQNRVEWHVADLAILTARGVTVPVYPTSATSQVAYVLRHSGARICFVENRAQLAKIVEHRAEIPELEKVVLFEAGDDADVRLDDPWLSAFDLLLSTGADALARDPELVRRRAAEVALDDLASIVYTSGTTGPPKGTMLSHANLVAALEGITTVIPIGPDDRFLSFLPLSHIAERVVSHFGQVVAGGETWFARSLTTVPEDLKDCRPTVFFAVPRVWEKFRDAILAQLTKVEGPQRLVLDHYRGVGKSHVQSLEERRRGSVLHEAQWLVLDHLVGTKLRKEIGLDKARVLVSSAAPLSRELQLFLGSIGLLVINVYGQTEVTGPSTLTAPGRVRLGTVGPALPGLLLRIADDGEVMVHGPSVCQGYFRDEENTGALLDPDGWMHTGDLGTLDEDGYLSITGRKKDLIKTAHGKYIAPQELELRLRSEPYVSQAVIVGEGRPYVTALVTLDTDSLRTWAAERGRVLVPEALAWDPDVKAHIADVVERVNRHFSQAEQIKKFRILPREFTVDAGEMTPTLKVIRGTVMEHYADVIEEMYAEGRTG